ncbi:MAG: hypothetical protein QM504_11865 [Pseudomonadota bacterium]
MDIILFITLLYIAYKSSKTINNESEILKEFSISKALSFLVYIYPAGPILVIFSAVVPQVILYPIVAACYLPQLILAKKQSIILERAGTNRVKELEKGLTLAIIGAIIGLAYLCFIIIVSISSYYVSTTHY